MKAFKIFLICLFILGLVFFPFYIITGIIILFGILACLGIIAFGIKVSRDCGCSKD
ncbi:hypothetical protein HMPREF9700_01864 [Bergeyella zoohelcum CCUG 30536]|uniref:Uncharacterized protein n=1 Tax=Bergeyella zoohelcum TaxID=1015 RepID=A0A380ZUX2_9FLAO|nr:hypothetical protein HMPREF9700_01864 [Bergeyella zoohelcum CCUG 30536]SUV53127.1 Uncharacterised protein [Bergeyella zoohelcum]